VDATTWQVFGLTLTIVGLLLSAAAWRRRGAASGLRGVAWSLLPAAAGFTGTLKLVYDIGEGVVTWATRLVFSPIVWAGIVLAGVSVVLFGVSGAMRARGVGRNGKTPKEPKQVSPGRSAPPATKSGSDDIEGMDDIEAILKKHGIQ
jgi:hypothetical protein